MNEKNIQFRDTEISIHKEPDDAMCKTRISIGNARQKIGGKEHMYLVYRGDMSEVVHVLETLLMAVKLGYQKELSKKKK